MTKYCPPLGTSESMNIKQLTGDPSGIVVIIIPNPVLCLLDSAVRVDLFTCCVKALYH